MAYQLKLKNVTNYNDETTTKGSKYYSVEAQNEDAGHVLELMDTDYM